MTLLDTDRELTRHSYYAATSAREQVFAPLRGAQTCDVAVVGGGLAGLSAAVELRQRGFDVALLEARAIGSGASGRNGGQAIHGLACDQATIEDHLGLAEARRVWDMSIEALALLRERMAQHAIDCEWRDGYLSLARTPGKGREQDAWADRIERIYRYPLRRLSPGELGHWIASPEFHSGIHDPRSGHLHPLKYTRGLARAAAAAGVRIFEASEVLALEPGASPRLRTAQGVVRASQVLLAGNVYLGALAPKLAARIMPVGTYIACSEMLGPALADSLIPSRSAACDNNIVFDSFRTTDDHRMLYGGRVSCGTRTPSNLAGSLRQRMVQTFPQLEGRRVEYVWGGFVDITVNRAPDFGRLDGFGGKVYYLQGFSGQGLALTGLAGRVVAEAMAGDASRFDVFAGLSHRNFPGGARLRRPALVLAMAWHRLRDMLA